MLFEVVNNQLVRAEELKSKGLFIRTSYQRIHAPLEFKNNPRGFVNKGLGDMVSITAALMQKYSNKVPKNPGEHPIGSVMITTIYNRLNEQDYEMTKVGYSLLHPKDHWNTKTALYVAAARSIPDEPFNTDFLDKQTVVNTVVETYLKS